MYADKPAHPLFQYLLSELHGARTTLLALISSTVSGLAAILGLLAAQLYFLVPLPAVLALYTGGHIPGYRRYLESVKSVVKDCATGDLQIGLLEAYKQEIEGREPGFWPFRRP